MDPSVKIEVLNPPSSLPEDANIEDQFNNNSVVIKLTYGNFTAIFPWDIEKETESRIAIKDIDADLLLASHHGSRGSNTSPYLDAVSPEIVIIYAGADNPYGHPHKEALERIRESGARIFRTDIDRIIVLQTDGKKYEISTTKSGITVTVPEFSEANTGVIIMFIIALVSLTNIIKRKTMTHGNNQSKSGQI